jgi:hypothetical protein
MRKFLVPLALLAGCGPLPPSAFLPADAVQGGTDPMRGAIISSAFAFNNPGGLADPAVAARASANVEYLAVNIPWEVRYNSTPTVTLQLAAARAELHQALAIAPDASPQAVVDGLYGVSRALRVNDPVAAANALPPAAFPDRAATLRRLTALGPLPRTAEATAMAESEQLRVEQERLNTTGGGDGNGRS